MFVLTVDPVKRNPSDVVKVQVVLVSRNSSYYYGGRSCQGRARGVLFNDPNNCQITQNRWQINEL